MSRRLYNLSAVLVCVLGLPTTIAIAQQVQTGPEIINETHHDTSIPIRFLAAMATHPANKAVLPLHRRPGPSFVAREAVAAEETVQQFPMPEVATTPFQNFDGLRDRDGVAPPDTNASVGSTQVVEVTNTSYRVFNKSTGASVFGPAEISIIWSGFGGVCGTSSNSFSDPVVLYDKAANRWLVTILGSANGFGSGVECIAVSSTSDATGSYHRYSFSFGTNRLNDYPKFGVWPDAYYASYNMFSPNAFVGAKVCAYNRSHMLAGLSANAVCFQRIPSPSAIDFSFLPSDWDGSTAPPAGEPNFFLELFTQKLDSLGDRLMFRLAYRNFGDHEALVAVHSVKGGSTASAVRWYEIRSPNGTPKIFQQGTFSISGLALWMPSIGMDKLGDIALGFSKSSGTTHPGLGYTGRIPSDPLGSMESAANIFVGAGSQTGGLSRWGDYSSMSIDPSDNCTFWYTNEYIPSNGSFNWRTRLASFKFTACH